VLGYEQRPNYTTGMLTFWNKLKNDGIVIQKENRYYVEYFHEIVQLLGISPEIFIRIAFGREEE
jgi:hypothetical protein